MDYYVVLVTPEAASSRVSQEAYKTFAQAESFILSRHGCLKQLTTHKWRDEDYTTYEIFELTIK